MPQAPRPSRRDLRDNQRNLVDVKAYWDPQNFFHHAQSIPVR